MSRRSIPAGRGEAALFPRRTIFPSYPARGHSGMEKCWCSRIRGIPGPLRGVGSARRSSLIILALLVAQTSWRRGAETQYALSAGEIQCSLFCFAGFPGQGIWGCQAADVTAQERQTIRLIVEGAPPVHPAVERDGSTPTIHLRVTAEKPSTPMWKQVAGAAGGVVLATLLTLGLVDLYSALRRRIAKKRAKKRADLDVAEDPDGGAFWRDDVVDDHRGPEAATPNHHEMLDGLVDDDLST